MFEFMIIWSLTI